jgi:hypothetical protein
MDISGFSPRDKPTSPFGADMKIRSADSPTRWLYELLNANVWTGGGSLFSLDGSPTSVAKESLFADYQMWARNAADRHPVARDQFHKTVRRLLADTVTESRPAAGQGQARERKLVFSDVSTCRTAFEQATKTVGTLTWDAV